MANKLISELVLLASGNIEGADWVEIQEADQLTTKKVTITVLNELEKAERVAQDNVIEASVGLSAAGAYVPPVGSNYLDASTDVMNALDILDGVAGTGSTLTIETVSVNNANCIAAGLAPYELIAAPGAGSFIDIISISCFNDNGGTDFEVGSQTMVVQYDTGATHFMEWSNAFVEASADVINKGTWTSNVTQLENKKVEMTYSTGANPTAGNGSMKFFLVYVTQDV